MTCKECRDALKRMPEVRVGGIPPAVEAHLVDCPSCRRKVTALLFIEDGAALRTEPPAGLVQSITPWRVPAPVEVPRQPRILRLVPLAAAAAVVIALGSFLLAHQGAGRATPQEMASVRLTFEAPAALSVSVCGDWNDWNPKAQPMKRQDGKWQIDLELKRGKTYQYQFLVNGETWIPDPKSPVKVDNGFGGVNSLIAS